MTFRYAWFQIPQETCSGLWGVSFHIDTLVGAVIIMILGDR